jgi:gamma-butyrobetaine dioxygenase
MRNLNLDAVPSDTRVKENGRKIEVTWDDNHVSEFDSDWLHKERISENKAEENETLFREDVQLWDKDFKIPTFEFDAVLNDEKSLLDWMLTLRRSGVTVLIGVPRKLGQLERLSDVVGFLKNTFYG